MGDNNETKNKNIIVTGLWQSRNGHYHSMPVDTKANDTLRQVLELGGRFLIRKRTAEAIQNSKDPMKAPVAYLEFVPKEAVEEFEEARKTRAEKQSL